MNAPDIRLADGSTYNGEDDPRVTKIGKFMRNTSVDELPQILNLLNGTINIRKAHEYENSVLTQRRNEFYRKLQDLG